MQLVDADSVVILKKADICNDNKEIILVVVVFYVLDLVIPTLQHDLMHPS